MTALCLAMALLVPAVVGYAIVSWTLGRASSFAGHGLRLVVGSALGFGATGCLAFLSLVLFDHVLLPFEVLVSGGLVFATLRSPWVRRERYAPRRGSTRWPRTTHVVLAAFLLTAGVAYGSVAISSPLGAWDAWAFWNQRALFFVRGGEDWHRGYVELLSWAQTYYPPLLPAAVARTWVSTASESVLVPAVLALVFSAAVVVTLYATVRRIRGAAQATLAVIVLVATPFFLTHGSSQYADILVAFYFLLTMACFAMHDRHDRHDRHDWHDRIDAGLPSHSFGAERRRRRFLLLAGLAAGFATFTKSEGSVFLATCLVSRAWLTWRLAGRRAVLRELGWFLLGAAPVAPFLAIFRLGYSTGPVIDFYTTWSGLGEHLVRQFTSWERYPVFVERWWYWLTSFDKWPVPVFFVLTAYGLLMGLAPDRPRTSVRAIAMTLVLQALAYSPVFLWLSAHPIATHMEALDRLLFQLFPTALLGTFLAVEAPRIGSGAVLPKSYA